MMKTKILFVALIAVMNIAAPFTGVSEEKKPQPTNQPSESEECKKIRDELADIRTKIDKVVQDIAKCDTKACLDRQREFLMKFSAQENALMKKFDTACL